MPVAYPGDQTHTQAPSAAPQPAGTVTVNLPADGDPPNASTYIQGYKVLADFIDWLLKPKAKLSDWAKPILQWRSGHGDTRALIDHLGLPGGRIAQWDENWLFAGVASGALAHADFAGTPVAYSASFLTALGQLKLDLDAAGSAGTLGGVTAALAAAGAQVGTMVSSYAMNLAAGRWFYSGKQTTGGAQAAVLPPLDAAAKRFRFAQLECGDTAADYAILSTQQLCKYDDDLTVALEWETYLPAANIPNRNIYVGLSEEDQSPGVSAQNYATFQLAPSGNWVVVNANGGVGTASDTLVAGAIGWTRFRLEFHGANVSDDGTRKLRAYINGILKATVASNVPAASAFACPHFSLVSAGGASGGTLPRLGPVKFRSNLYAGDFI